MSWKYRNRSHPSRARALSILRRPLVTEKTTLASEYSQVAFEVALDANKHEIGLAVAELFKVKVKSVNTSVRKGKIRRFRGRKGQLRDRKIAYVTLADGQLIDVEAGL